MSDTKLCCTWLSQYMYVLSMNNRKWVHFTFLYVNTFHSWIQRVSQFAISWQHQSLDMNSTGSEWISTCFMYVQLYHYLQIVKFQFSHCMLTLVPDSSLSRWAISMHEILVYILICILACMSPIQLIWWFHAPLPSACTFLFVFNNCKIYLYLWWTTY